MAEEMIRKLPMQNQKASDVKTKKSEKIIEVKPKIYPQRRNKKWQWFQCKTKTQPISPIELREKSKLKLYIYLQWRGEKQKDFRFSHDENAITRRVMKFDHSLRFLGFRKNWKLVVDQPKHKKSPSEKFSDQIKEEKQTNPGKGAS